MKKKKIDFDRLSVVDIAAIFRKSVQTVYAWIKKDCPQNEDGTFCLVAVHYWLKEKQRDA